MFSRLKSLHTHIFRLWRRQKVVCAKGDFMIQRMKWDKKTYIFSKKEDIVWLCCLFVSAKKRRFFL